jgi:hypothetical protein
MQHLCALLRSRCVLLHIACVLRRHGYKAQRGCNGQGSSTRKHTLTPEVTVTRQIDA